MGMVNVNPEAELRPEFETVKAGTYAMRIKAVKDRNPEKNDLEVQLEHVDVPANLTNLRGEPCKAVGGVFDYIPLAHDKQWKLRQVTQAAGLPWQSYDPVTELLGRELQVVIKLDLFEGEQRNKVARYVVTQNEPTA